jgi:hypothetical protein
MNEHALQVAVAHMLQLVLDPERTWWSAIDHAAKLSPRYGADRKRRGVKPGMPDFIVMANHFVPAVIVGIELKYAKGKLSPAQIEVRDSWQLMGHMIYVARSLEEVQEILEHCHVPMLRRMNFLGGGYDRAERPAPARHHRARRPRKSKNHLPLVLADAAQKN